ncbi:DEAD/DEAH box helicase [Massilia glaciei]|uniref:DEAD/DEAH box helicase n=1 Tax=Massilia glaciei TaxID=1524097 RepID=A0A2U2HLG5_9BURK|nr:DEAD/DEAH box helicase [Massilia glaciei]PWF48350.1 hypothetical protein C7C56_012390 [Massilia glaciei]
MNQLVSYALTPGALQTLASCAAPPERIPTAWFNWTGAKGARNFNVERLSLVSVDCGGEELLRWSENARSAGYGCVLIAHVGDGFHLGDLKGLDGDVGFIAIAAAPAPAAPEEHALLLATLREPDDFFGVAWSALRRGGSGKLYDYESVTREQWWGYAVALQKWIEETREGGPNAHARQRRADFSIWRAHAGLQIRLGLAECWDLGARWLADDVGPLKASGYAAYFPMRQMGCCGVAVDHLRRLHTVGALSADWEWDDGTVRAAMARAARTLVPERAREHAIFALAGATLRGMLGHAFHATPLARASSAQFSATIVLEQSDRIEISWSAHTLTVRPFRYRELSALRLVVFGIGGTGGSVLEELLTVDLFEHEVRLALETREEMFFAITPQSPAGASMKNPIPIAAEITDIAHTREKKTMEIGFPIIASVLGQEVVVCAYISARPDDEPTVTMLDRENGSRAEVAFASPYLEHLQQFTLKGYSVDIVLDGDVQARKAVLGHNNRLNLNGASGTLAFHLLATFHKAIAVRPGEERVLVTGLAAIVQHRWQVNPLNSADTELKAAYAKQKKLSLWIHRDDYDALADKGTETETVFEPFYASNGSPSWLLAEFATRYALPLAEQVAPPPDIPEGTLTERDLFAAAVDPKALRPTSQEDWLNEFFKQRPARALLPIQIQALQPGNFDKVFAPFGGNSEALRHTLISGPTGCGKTTLLQALVLNGLHNRAGSVLYIGPTRALVEEFHENISEDLKALLPQQQTVRVMLSTGDYSKDDYAIASGRFGLACIVNEKANLLFSSEDSHRLLNNLTMIIVDELHMLADPSRGGLLDLLISHATQVARLRLSGEFSSIPLQIVGITTEGMAQKLVELGWLDFRVDDDDAGPCLLNVSDRPVPVRHKVAVMYEIACKGEPDWVEKDIVEFKENANRHMTPSDLEMTMRTLAPSRTEADSFNRRANQRNYISRQIHDFILSKRKVHQTTIVAVKSVSDTESYANALWKRLDNLVDQCPVPEKYAFALYSSGLTETNVGNMLRWAARGIYVHSSQLPRKLREVIAKIFRAPVLANEKPKVLMCTETLTYGVNLSASCLILTTLEMSRDNPADPFAIPTPQRLGANQYHNLLGRAGRLGYKNSHTPPAEAIVCIPLSAFAVPALRQRFLNDFYTETNTKSLSYIVLQSDLDTLKRVGKDVPPKFSAINPKHALEDYSFPLFRTVLDSVRKANKNRMEGLPLITRFIQSTVGYQSSGNKGKLDELCLVVLKKASEYREGGILLISTQGSAQGKTDSLLHSLLPAGAALIDTGTSLHAVAPISRWLDALRQHPASGNWSVEALLPGLICAPDFGKVAGELVPEASQQPQMTPQALSELEEAVRSRLRLELDILQLALLMDVLTSYIENEAFGRAFVNQLDSALKKVVLLKLLTMVLMWLRGATTDEMTLVARINQKQKSKDWGQKHAEKLETLCSMCYRFFGNQSGFLHPHHLQQLPQLAVRVKHGLSFGAMPFLNVFPSDGVLPRQAIVKMHEKVGNPFNLLSDNHHPFEQITKVLAELPQGSVVDTNSVIQIVKRSYDGGLDDFLEQLTSDTDNFFRLAREALCMPKADCFSARWRPQTLLDVALEQCDGRNILFTNRDGAVGVEEIGGEVSVVFTTDPHYVNPHGPLLRLLGWHEQEEIPSITPCAYVLLVACLRRGLLEFGDLFAIVDSPAPAQRIDVAWIMSKLAADQILKDMPSLQEFLLGFIEPAASRKDSRP